MWSAASKGKGPCRQFSQATARGRELLAFGEYLMQCLPKYISKTALWKDELSVHLHDEHCLLPALHFLRDHRLCSFKQCTEITAVDTPSLPKRFELYYALLSHRYNSRLLVRVRTDELSPVPSVTGLYGSAGWSEREVYDMFGVLFSGHPDLRRLLTDYGFEGHPMRKEFPLSGFTELRYDHEQQRIVYEPVELAQEYRRFDLGNAWEQVPRDKIEERK